MEQDLTNNQLVALSLLNVVGPDQEYSVTLYGDGEICILRPGTKDDPLVTLNRYDYDNLLERELITATATFYAENETEKVISKFRLSRVAREEKA